MVIDKIRKVSDTKIKTRQNIQASDKMVGKWMKCEYCKETLYKEEVRANLSVCPNCGKHFRLSARRRIAQILDEGTFREQNTNMQTTNPLDFKGYLEKIHTLQEKTNIKEAIKTGFGEIEGQKVAIGVMDENFMMGSMGCVVGEKITCLIEEAIQRKLPVILFCASGGARMQEGMLSLMQMAKTSSAVAKLAEAGLLYISVLTDPTTGGVTASFASLGDIILAEPGSFIGFAGPRVIEQTIGQSLPEGFQKAEFLLEHGFIDKIVERKDMKKILAQILRLHTHIS